MGAVTRAGGASRARAAHAAVRLPASVRAALATRTVLGWMARMLGVPVRLLARASMATGRIVGALLAPVGRACIIALSPVGRVTRPLWHPVVRAVLGIRRRVGALGTRLGRRAKRQPHLVALCLAAVLMAVGSVFTLALPATLAIKGASATPNASLDNQGMASLAQKLGAAKVPLSHHPLAPASAAPVPAPRSVADSQPLRSHEMFGFAPYWTLPQASGFDVADLTTLAYFSVDVNPNGSLDESGEGWNGFQSQDFASLATRAHQAGDRVVLAVSDFDQASLNALTSDPSAPARLADSLLSAVQAKNLDGVNLDFEGEGSADQTGLTNLVSRVSSTFHAANPDYQVTMDTYASSAGDTGGFYNIAALSPLVDGFFVMDYDQNLTATPTSASAITSGEFSAKSTLQQYTRIVPPAKVILGTPFYGEDFPTTNGTLGAAATGGASTPSYAEIVASGHPVYWDPVTDTAWTSYRSGSSWHETYFMDPTALYMDAKLAQSYGVGGMGIWALGMDGNDPAMVGALLGNAPAEKDALVGPTSTGDLSSDVPTMPSVSAPGQDSVAPSTSTTGSPGSSGSPTTTGGGSTTSTSTKSGSSTTTSAPPSTTTTTAPAVTATFVSTSGVTTSGVTVTRSAKSSLVGTGTVVGRLTTFTTTNASLSCLSSAVPLTVMSYAAYPGRYFVQTSTSSDPPACVSAILVFTPPGSTPPTTTTTTTPPTTTTTSPPTTSSTTTTQGASGATTAAALPSASTTEPTG